MAKKEKHPQEELPQVESGQVEGQAGAEGEAGDAEQPSYEQLVAALAEANASAEASREQLLRGQAELDNVRKRAERDVQNAHKYALEKFVSELLPVKDSLEMGYQAASAEGADLEKVREGVELTLKMFVDALGKFGVKEINPEGGMFNPDEHQAMTMQDVPDAAPNTVINVFQKGFSLNDRLVRPAMVVVAGPNSGGKESSGSSKIDELA